MKVYTISQFAKEAQTTTRTIRFYIKNGLLISDFDKNLNVTILNEKDFVTMQMIDMLKAAKFTLNEIKQILDNRDLNQQLKLQKNILLKQITESQTMLEMINELETNPSNSIDYLKLYQHHLKKHHYYQQFIDYKPLDVRIQFHERYNHEEREWFLWLYDQYLLNENDTILDIGCGQGTLWQKNSSRLPLSIKITLADTSASMIEYCQKNLNIPQIKQICTADIQALPFADNTFDVVIANHIFMYFDDLDIIFKEINRVLKPNGRLYASTISKLHNLELEELLKKFDNRANMGQKKLTDQFSLENGKNKLSLYFNDIRCYQRQTTYHVDDPNLLAKYIYSTKWIGNIQDVLDHRYNEFYHFIKKVMNKNNQVFITNNCSGQFSAVAKKDIS